MVAPLEKKSLNELAAVEMIDMITPEGQRLTLH